MRPAVPLLEGCAMLLDLRETPTDTDPRRAPGGAATTGGSMNEQIAQDGTSDVERLEGGLEELGLWEMDAVGGGLLAFPFIQG